MQSALLELWAGPPPPPPRRVTTDPLSSHLHELQGYHTMRGNSCRSQHCLLKVHFTSESHVQMFCLVCRAFFMQMWVTRRGFLSHTDVPFLFKMMVVAACCTAIKPLSSSSRLKEACSYLTLTLSWGAFPSQVVHVSLHKDMTGAQSKENCFYVDFSEWLLQTHYCSVFKMHLCKYLF